MRTSTEIADKVYKSSGEMHWDWQMVESACKQYAKEVLQEFVSYETGEGGCITAWKIGNKIGVSVDQDKLEKFMNKLE